MPFRTLADNVSPPTLPLGCPHPLYSQAVMTVTSVFLGWPKVAAVVYAALALLLAYQYLRWVRPVLNKMFRYQQGLQVGCTPPSIGMGRSVSVRQGLGEGGRSLPLLSSK